MNDDAFFLTRLVLLSNLTLFFFSAAQLVGQGRSQLLQQQEGAAGRRPVVVELASKCYWTGASHGLADTG